MTLPLLHFIDLHMDGCFTKSCSTILSVSELWSFNHLSRGVSWFHKSIKHDSSSLWGVAFVFLFCRAIYYLNSQSNGFYAKRVVTIQSGEKSTPYFIYPTVAHLSRQSDRLVSCSFQIFLLYSTCSVIRPGYKSLVPHGFALSLHWHRWKGSMMN